MDIADAVTTEYVSLDPSTPVSKLRGTFDQDARRAVVVETDDGFEGVVAESDLLSSHHDPEEKVGSVMRAPPRVRRKEDVRETARLMVESELKLLPVFEGSRFHGVVTDYDLLALVRSNLSVLDVEDVFTRDLIHVAPDDTIGELINVVSDHSITRVPVVDDGEARGIVSVHDLVDFTVRQLDREQSGAPDGFDAHGGSGSHEGFRTHRGYGERAGESARLLDLPARDVMSTPVETVTADTSLDDAVGRILEEEYSSLLVESRDVQWPLGIVTTTDVLQALTVTEDDHVDVQVFGVDLLDTLTRADIADRVEEIDEKYGEMDILEANVVFHRHKERNRGIPLVLSTVRLFTDEGRFTGSAEEYGATAAFGAAADVAEENVLEDKGRKQTRERNEMDRERTERLLGWWLDG
ncbi:CBS domain-containing protein [Haloarchaeobius sp. HRN-SO-5]|uniref:CBS domain-containing protein n=1 Tax=Haloarchaeobius sp. HRN-SO-5 TaxID=3446118 RepID=UPI003EBED412